MVLCRWDILIPSPLLLPFLASRVLCKIFLLRIFFLKTVLLFLLHAILKVVLPEMEGDRLLLLLLLLMSSVPSGLTILIEKKKQLVFFFFFSTRFTNFFMPVS